MRGSQAAGKAPRAIISPRSASERVVRSVGRRNGTAPRKRIAEINPRAAASDTVRRTPNAGRIINPTRSSASPTPIARKTIVLAIGRRVALAASGKRVSAPPSGRQAGRTRLPAPASGARAFEPSASNQDRPARGDAAQSDPHQRGAAQTEIGDQHRSGRQNPEGASGQRQPDRETGGDRQFLDSGDQQAAEDRQHGEVADGWDQEESQRQGEAQTPLPGGGPFENVPEEKIPSLGQPEEQGRGGHGQAEA